MKKLLIIATGGTIACVPSNEGLRPGLTGSQLVEAVPQLAELANCDVQQLMNIDSSDMISDDWLTIAQAVDKNKHKYDGIVITHGTDTMCYTAAALSFCLGTLALPVILTGSQKQMMLADSDAPANILAACHAACCADLNGVFVVFNQKIIAGPRAFKMYAKNKDAYVSRNFPYVGKANETGAEIQFQMPELPQRNSQLALNDKVMLLKVMPSTDSSILDFARKTNVSGVVIEGYGMGGISNLQRGMLDAIYRLNQEASIPVVLISQCPYDGVNLNVYQVGEQAKAMGVISGGDMTTEAAVVKLMWALAQTKDLNIIRNLIETNWCHEMSM